MQDILTIINSVGFPIFVAIWMLVKDSQEKKQTRETLERLTIAIQKLDDNFRKY